MALSIKFAHEQARKDFEIVESSRGDGTRDCLVHTMAIQAIAKITNSLSQWPYVDLRSSLVDREILPLIEGQASQLPPVVHMGAFTSISVNEYLAEIDQVIAEARTGGASEIYDRLEALRAKGMSVCPHRKEEIMRLIQAKREIGKLLYVFHFCRRVERLGESPTGILIDRVMYDFYPRPLEGEGIQAFERAQRKLEELSTLEKRKRLDEMCFAVPASSLLKAPPVSSKGSSKRSIGRLGKAAARICRVVLRALFQGSFLFIQLQFGLPFGFRRAGYPFTRRSFI